MTLLTLQAVKTKRKKKVENHRYKSECAALVLSKGPLTWCIREPLTAVKRPDGGGGGGGGRR